MLLIEWGAMSRVRLWLLRLQDSEESFR